jgi:leucyl-tRNA synthetase
MIWTRVSHGMILGSDNQKMSKSKGNVINPDDIVKEFGADALRTYEMFMGDYQMDAPWSTESLKGCKRFLDKVERLKDKINDQEGYTESLETLQNKTIKKIEYDMTHMGYNTVISSLMILVNAYDDLPSITKADYRLLLILLNPIAPHITEELNELIGCSPLCDAEWPVYDEEKTIENTKEIAVQVNGKVRGTIKISIHDNEQTIQEKAMENENVEKHLEGKEIVKVIVIKGKIVNIVVK